MEYRKLGTSGLQVSTVGLGTNNFGGRVDEERSATVVRQAVEEGINFIDTANNMPANIVNACDMNPDAPEGAGEPAKKIQTMFPTVVSKFKIDLDRLATHINRIIVELNKVILSFANKQNSKEFDAEKSADKLKEGYCELNHLIKTFEFDQNRTVLGFRALDPADTFEHLDGQFLLVGDPHVHSRPHASPSRDFRDRAVKQQFAPLDDPHRIAQLGQLMQDV